MNGSERNDVFKFLVSNSPTPKENVRWNFEKFLVDRSGKVIWRFPNCTLLNFGYETGICDTPDAEKLDLESKIVELLEKEWDGGTYAG